MKTISVKFLMTLILSGSLISLFSCEEGIENPVVNTCENWSDEIEDELNAFNASLQDFIADPSTAKCNAFRNAAYDYVDALESVLECDGITNQQKNEIENAVEQAEVALEEMVCEV